MDRWKHSIISLKRQTTHHPSNILRDIDYTTQMIILRIQGWKNSPLNEIHQRDKRKSIQRIRVKIEEIILLTKPKANFLKIHSLILVILAT